MKSVLDLKPGETGIIQAFANDNDLKNKLIGMGCLPGENIRISKTAPLGCPIAIDIAGYELSLRKDEAACILIETDR